MAGLAAFTSEQHTKEIGVRKVFGASIFCLVDLVSKDLCKSILMANVVAWTIAYYVMSKWLQDFAYRTDIKVWVFLLGGIISIIIAWLTMSIRSYRASIKNLVDSIRVE